MGDIMEIRDLYDKDRNVTGKTMIKGETIPEGYYMLVVLIFIQDKNGKFLIQKRSVEKNGKYATTGGHPKSGESSIDGVITEVKEELGLDINKEDLTLYFSERFDDERVFCDDYYIKMDIDLDSLLLQEEEVESVHLFTKDEIIDLYNNGLFFMNHFYEFELLIKWLEETNRG